ncbi:MAG: nitrate/nitrite transporter NrtS [Candidatus Binatia bacterium]|nr:nitrate/nitrite transporter NrtS [Candidatus Binatia bacterium]
MTSASSRSATLRRFLYHWFRRETVVRALKVAGVVGPILTVINQYDVLLRLEVSPRLLAKIFLTFLVPYCVSSFSSARAYMESELRTEAAGGHTARETPLAERSIEQ